MALQLLDMFPTGRPSPEYDAIKGMLADLTLHSRSLTVVIFYRNAVAISVLLSFIAILVLFSRKKAGLWLYLVSTIAHLACYLILPVFLFTGFATAKEILLFFWSGFLICILMYGPGRKHLVSRREQNGEPPPSPYAKPGAAGRTMINPGSGIASGEA